MERVNIREFLTERGAKIGDWVIFEHGVGCMVDKDLLRSTGWEGAAHILSAMISQLGNPLRVMRSRSDIWDVTKWGSYQHTTFDFVEIKPTSKKIEIVVPAEVDILQWSGYGSLRPGANFVGHVDLRKKDDSKKI